MLKQEKTEKQAGRAYHHGNLRAAAIEAAIEALARKMPGEISLRELAKTIGVGHSALYTHFRDRDELFAVVSEQGFESLLAEMQAACAEAGDRIAQLSGAYLRFARANPAHYRVMFGPTNMVSPVGSQIAAVCNGCLQMLVDAIAEAADVPQDEAHRRAIGVWCVLHGLVSLAGADGPLHGTVSDEEECRSAPAFARVLALHG